MSLLSEIAIAIKTKLGGTSINNTIPRYDGTSCTLKNSGVTISDANVVTAGGGFIGNLTGTASNATLAASATKLATACTINGVAFDGTANITVADSTKAPLTGAGASGTWGINITGNAAEATKLSTTRDNYRTITDSSVVGELMWKNYGNNHTIFDASNSTAPTGVATNNTNPDFAWGPKHPTLMGYNGSHTFGVRVDSSRFADQLRTARNINGVPFDGTANITVQTLPIGAILNGYTIFDNCIVAFGGEFNRADYPKLWAYLQANPSLVKTQAQWQTEATANGGICGFFSDGNGTTTFRVPNLDKAFLRPDNRGVGSYQRDEFKSHNHTVGKSYTAIFNGGSQNPYMNPGSEIVPTSYTGGTETRPKNIAVLPLIVAK